MIYPTPRLLALVAVAGMGMALAYAASPVTLPAIGAGVALLTAAALLDATTAGRALRRVRASLPELWRGTVLREGALRVRLEWSAGVSSPLLELALLLPPEVTSPRATAQQRTGTDAGTVVIDWPITPQARGNRALSGVYVNAGSLLGLWRRRVLQESPCELRAYPNLMEERSNLAALFLNRAALGVHAQRQVGKGKEFEKLREYLPGDNYEDVDWKATAKRAKPVTKEFQIERTQEIYVVIDSSRLSARPVGAVSGCLSKPATQLERFITSAMVLGLVAQKQGDLYGLATFSDRVDTFVRAKGGQAHHRGLRDALYTLQPKRVNPDFAEVCTFLRLRLRRRALIFFLTNLDDEVLAEAFTRDIQLLSRQHIVLVNTMNLPGIRPLFTQPETGSVDEIYRHLAGHLQWQKLRESQGVLRRHGVTLNLLDHATAAPQLVTQYMNVKRRQAL